MPGEYGVHIWHVLTPICSKISLRSVNSSLSYNYDTLTALRIFRLSRKYGYILVIAVFKKALIVSSCLAFTLR